MKIKQVAKISSGQDGAIFGGLLFRFNHRGVCNAFDLKKIGDGQSLEPLSVFTLDRAEELVPHSNAVMFGNEYSTEGFSNSEQNPPAIRIIDPNRKEQICFIDIVAMGYYEEPELIDFDGDTCYYSDIHGNLYTLDLDN